MSESITITGRVSSAPSERGSTTGQTCPDLLTLADGEIGVIGEVPTNLPEENQDLPRLVVPLDLAVDALTKFRFEY